MLPSLPGKRKALAVAAGAVIVGGGLYWASSKIGAARRRATKRTKQPDLPAAKGHFLTQAEVGLATMTWASTAPTDFVLVAIASADEKFVEWVWAEVVAAKSDQEKVYVQLRGELGESSAEPLATARHGFRIGARAFIGRDEILDRLRSHPAELEEKGKVYCGVFAEELTGDDLMGGGQLIVKPGDRVRLAISTKVASDAYLEEPWVMVEGVSRTGNVVSGTIIDKLENSAQHGFRQWDELEFTHDCILEAK